MMGLDRRPDRMTTATPKQKPLAMDQHPLRHAADNDLSGTTDTWPLNAVDAARVAGVSERTIRRAIARGDLPASKHAGIYRIARVDLERYRLRTPAIDATPLGSHDGRLPFPSPISPLIGRQGERAAVRELLLRAGVRLVTLTGPGGVGKTRLAREIQREIADLFEDGACFVDLSSLRDERLVLPTIAQAIGVRETRRRALDETIRTFLQPREFLLALDNCEQVVAAAPQIAALMSACPMLSILATSRIPLRIRDEYRFPVEPLPLPLPAAGQDPADLLTQSDAMRLYVERARAVYPALATTPDDLRAIASICQRLDGLPLAIELAAAWSALLPPAELLARLSETMRLPGRGPRDLPHRQRTVWDTIAWSYDLLPPDAQDLFRRLGVFVDGFDVDAAIAVVRSPAAAVLGQLGVLVEQSLLRRVGRARDGARFAMLETVREFAWQRAEEQSETEEVRGRHAEYFLDLAERIESVLYGPETRQNLDRLESEYPNCLAARRYFVEVGDTTRELRLAAMLNEHWLYRGQISEGISVLNAAIERGETAPPGPRAKAMAELAILLLAAGSNEQAHRLSAASVELAREAGNPFRLGQALWVRANVIGSDAGRTAEAIAILQDAVHLAREHKAPVASYQSALAAMGTLWIRLGERERGVNLIQEALVVLRASGRRFEMGASLLRLGRMDRQDGNIAQAAARYGEALRVYREAGVVTQVGFALAELAGLAAASAYPETAARIAGMIQAICDRTGVAFDGDSPYVVVHVETETRTTLDYGRLDAVTAGRSLPFSDALTEAIAIADALAEGKPPPGGSSHRPSRAAAHLSPRERHVLALLAQRYTAPEIAYQLFLSVRTVERHVSNVYNKLGVNSRRAAVAVATRKDLV
jgi:predicted ATPase/DNA-binding CsgD family transcriptional regulator